MTVTRRDFLRGGLLGGVLLAVARGGLAPRLASALLGPGGLESGHLTTLAAAAEVIVLPGRYFAPDGTEVAEPDGGGAFTAYVEGLRDDDTIFLGGPTRDDFGSPVAAPPEKRLVWDMRTERRLDLLRRGAEMLDQLARDFRRGDGFAEMSLEDREMVLYAADAELLDLYSRPRFNLSAAELFDELYDLTLEAVYGDPAYLGGSKDGQHAWKRLGYAGDQFVRDPDTGELAGGFEPEVLAEPAPPSPNPYGPRFSGEDALLLLAASDARRAAADDLLRSLTAVLR